MGWSTLYLCRTTTTTTTTIKRKLKMNLTDTKVTLSMHSHEKTLTQYLVKETVTDQDKVCLKADRLTNITSILIFLKYSKPALTIHLSRDGVKLSLEGR